MTGWLKEKEDTKIFVYYIIDTSKHMRTTLGANIQVLM